MLFVVPSTIVQNAALDGTRLVTGALFYSGHAAAVTVVFMYPRARKGRRKEAAKRSDAPPSHARMRRNGASPPPTPCILSKYYCTHVMCALK